MYTFCSTASVNKLCSIIWLTIGVSSSGWDPPEMEVVLKPTTEAGTLVDSAIGDVPNTLVSLIFLELDNKVVPCQGDIQADSEI